MDGALVRSAAIQFMHFAGTTGLTLKAVVLSTDGAGAFNFTSGAFVANYATATWSDLQRAMTEIVDTGPNPIAVYSTTSTFPAALIPGNYTVVVQDGTTAVDNRLAVQPMYWDGTYWTPHDGTPVTEARDLRQAPKENQWSMVQRAGGVVSLNPVTIYQGETKKLGYDLRKILSPSDVPATMGTPTASDTDLTPTKVGIGPTWANLTLAVASDTTAGSYTVTTTITTDEGDGPITMIGDVTVVATP